MIKRLIFLFLLITTPVFAQDPSPYPPLIVEEEDASPSVSLPWKIKFDNSSLTDNADGTVSHSIVTGGAGTFLKLDCSNDPLTGNLDISDNIWMGLGSSAGRIEFDNQTNDEINFLNCLSGWGTSTPSYIIDVQSAFPSIGSITFTGTGNDDMTNGGTFTGAVDTEYVITIDDGLTDPNTFEWTYNGNPGNNGVAIWGMGAQQTLNNGVYIAFGNTTGHNLDDEWTFTVSVIDPLATRDNSGTARFIVNDAGDITTKGTSFAFGDNTNTDITFSFDASNDGIITYDTSDDDFDFTDGISIVKDSGKLLLGATNDLEIYHDDTNAYITNNTGDLYLSAAGGDIDFDDDTLTTTSTGTFGDLDVDTLNLNNNVISDSTGDISFDNENLTTTGTMKIGAPTGTYALEIDGNNFPIFQMANNQSTYNGIASAFRLLTRKAVDMTDGFGGGFVFSIEDDTSGPQNIGRMSAARDGADNQGRLQFEVNSGLDLAGYFDTNLDFYPQSDIQLASTNKLYFYGGIDEYLYSSTAGKIASIQRGAFHVQTDSNDNDSATATMFEIEEGSATIGSGTSIFRLKKNAETNLGDVVFEGTYGLCYGEIYGNDVDDTITISDTTQANKVQITSFNTNGASNNSTPDHTNDHITITKAGHYLCNGMITIESTTTNAAAIGISVYKNNGATEFPNCHSSINFVDGVVGEMHSVTLTGIIDCAVNDTIEVWIWNDTNADDIVIADISLNITQIGGT